MPMGGKQWKRLLKHSERLAAAGFASRGSDGLDVNDSNASNGSSSSGNTTELEISKREMQHFMFLSAMKLECKKMAAVRIQTCGIVTQGLSCLVSLLLAPRSLCFPFSDF